MVHQFQNLLSFAIVFIFVALTATEPTKDTCSRAECSPLANCINMTTYLVCKCKDGYSGDGIVCEDTNECFGKNNCDAHAQCTNTIGSYTCQCHLGYEGDGCNCTYLDECEQGLDNCSDNALCKNTDTKQGFNCTCKTGYSGNGVICQDINECLDEQNCPKNSICINNNGSFTCPCVQGYTKNNSKCVDIDECFLQSPLICADNRTCINTDGGFYCACANGICKQEPAERKTNLLTIIVIACACAIVIILVVVAILSVCKKQNFYRNKMTVMQFSGKKKEADSYKTLENSTEQSGAYKFASLKIDKLHTGSINDPVPSPGNNGELCTNRVVDF